MASSQETGGSSSAASRALFPSGQQLVSALQPPMKRQERTAQIMHRQPPAVSPRLQVDDDTELLSGGERGVRPRTINPLVQSPTQSNPLLRADPQGASDPSPAAVFLLQMDHGFSDGFPEDSRHPASPPTPQLSTSFSMASQSPNATFDLTEPSKAVVDSAAQTSVDGTAQTVLTGSSGGGAPARRLRVAATDASLPRRSRSPETSEAGNATRQRASAPVSPREAATDRDAQSQPGGGNTPRSGGGVFDRLTASETESTRRQKLLKQREHASWERQREMRREIHGAWLPNSTKTTTRHL